MDTYQVMPDLSEEDYQNLKASIKEHGIEVAVVYDAEGNILDGHHRARACKELGISWPRTVRADISTDDEKRKYALEVNINRRHLTGAQKRELIKKMVEANPEKSNRAIAKEVGVDHKTVSAVKCEGGECPHGQETQKKDNRRAKVRRALLREPRESNAAIGAACGISGHVVGTVREQLEAQEKIPAVTNQDKFALKSERRAATLRSLLSKGHNLQQCQDELKLGRKTLVDLALRHAIVLPTHSGRARRALDVNRVIDAAVTNVHGYLTNLETIESRLGDIHTYQLDPWISFLEEAQVNLAQLLHMLQEAKNGNTD